MRTVFRLDAAFELVLAVILAVAATGRFGSDSWGRPSWLGTPALAVGAIGLLLAALVLFGLSTFATRPVLAVVAGANGVTAIGAASWAVLGGVLGAEFRLLLVVTAVGLVVLSAAQLRLTGSVEEIR